MKILVLVLIMLLVFSGGCYVINQNKSILQCFNEASIMIKYEEESSGDYWKSPLETYLTKKGDCEDKSLYLQRLLLSNGYESDLVVGISVVIIPTTKSDSYIPKFKPKYPTTQPVRGTIKPTIKSPINIAMHAWVEINVNNETYILDPTTSTIFRRKGIPSNMYVKIFSIIIEQRMKDYKKRTNTTRPISKQYGL